MHSKTRRRGSEVGPRFFPSGHLFPHFSPARRLRPDLCKIGAPRSPRRREESGERKGGCCSPTPIVAPGSGTLWLPPEEKTRRELGKPWSSR